MRENTKLSDRPTTTTTTTKSKLKSGFGWGEKKTTTSTTTTTATVPNKKKPPLSTSSASNISNNHSRVKRSILGDFACSANPAQVYPHNFKSTSASSRDLFLELDHLRNLLKESKEREVKLRDELVECRKTSSNVSKDVEREVERKRSEAEDLNTRVSLLEAENKHLSKQLVSKIEEEECGRRSIDVDVQVVELRRLNKELQLQKRDLSCKLSAAESRLAALERISQSDVVAKVEAEASLLRHTNEDLCKQVEGLQMSRLTEVEELVYLRWVNSCLRNELRNSGSDKAAFNINAFERDGDEAVSPFDQKGEPFEFSNVRRLSLMKKLNIWPVVDENSPISECNQHLLDKDYGNSQEEKSPRRRHSISGVNCCTKDSILIKRRQSDGFICSKDMGIDDEKYDLGVDQNSPRLLTNRQETSKISVMLDVEKRALRIPNPPPRPLSSVPSAVKEDNSGPTAAPPPPPPPPPPPLPPKVSTRNSTGTVQRAPQVVEFYHSLMKRDSRKDCSSGGMSDAPDVANVRSSMIDEIENRSSHLLAIKADVETQGEFVNSLIREVNGAAYQDIEDVVAFVKWLDDELFFLVDERAVLKHFDWPEKKADTLREAAFGYRDLKKLESEVTYYQDDPRLPCDTALKKMVALSEKMERSVYSLLRTRDVLMRHCKEFRIPTDWMLDTGIISKIKFGSVKLAKKYMERVAMELQSKRVSEKDPALEYMLLQGVRFAFRMHQFAGGFDADTMHAFEELRNLAHFSYDK